MMVCQLRLGATGMLLAATLSTSPVLDGQGAQPSVRPLSPTVPGGVRVLNVTADEASAVIARVFDQAIALRREGDGRWGGLVGIDLDVAPRTYPVVVEVRSSTGAESMVRTSLVVGARRFPTRTLSVAPKFTDPPPRELARIREEAARLTALYREVSDKAWTGGFVAPVPGPATSSFGARSIFNGQARAPHAGTDFRGTVGTPVVAPSGGRIVLAEDLYMTGKTVVVDHGDRLLSVLAHLSSIHVSSGQDVTAGTLVGRVGATGRVTGPHLHWSVRLGASRVDPLLLLEALPAPGPDRPQSRKESP